ncbi:MAG: DUF4942 domain-containing protein [Candidatus Lokiarchaeota archaeon]|nr:DUF4942 domain-containing protein [Candidatus Lokiarchaeota archaeon]
MKEYYPTPEDLIRKMCKKIDWSSIKYILEPSAGKGGILDYIKESKEKYSFKFSCIEVEPEFQAILRDKKYNVIDSDFLSYQGADAHDLIIMNPPFSNGDQHLFKAINMMFSGQIVCLLNAETLRNPYSNLRKELVKKLIELDAEIEYIENAFVDAERKTVVEVALVYINMIKPISDLFSDCKKGEEVNPELEEKNEVAHKDQVEYLVSSFNHTIKLGIEQIKSYFSNWNRLSPYLKLVHVDNDAKYQKSGEIELKIAANEFVDSVRRSYWKRILEIKKVRDRMTQEKINEFHAKLNAYSSLDFTESNIRQFMLNIIQEYGNTLEKAVEEIFDKMTLKHSWYKETDKNILHFNGWKTNKAFYVNSKVILPMAGGYGGGFIDDWSGNWLVGYNVIGQLHDIDVVMNYFSGFGSYKSIVEALEEAFAKGGSKNIESSFFIISVYKKGTIHLTFRDEGIRRRFNIMACKGKKWLPEDYGTKAYKDMTTEEKDVVESFEGKENYNKGLNQIGFAKNQLLLN